MRRTRFRKINVLEKGLLILGTIVDILIELVKTQQQAQAVCNITSHTHMIGLDCEGCSLSCHGKLCIVQASCHPPT